MKPAQRGRPAPRHARTDSGDATDNQTPASTGGSDFESAIAGGPDINGPVPKALIESPEKPGDKGELKSGPPTAKEWQDFIGRILLRTVLEGYVTLMLRDFDLTPAEEQAIALSKEDLSEMAAPFAGFASRNKLLRKHGREIIAATDSWEAMVAITIWMRRVNRIASRHRKTQPKQEKQPRHQNVVNVPQMSEVYERASGNGTSGENAEQRRTFVVPPAGAIYNPGTG